MQVLVVPLPSAESHTFVMVKVVQELAARGHQVLVTPPPARRSKHESIGGTNICEANLL